MAEPVLVVDRDTTQPQLMRRKTHHWYSSRQSIPNEFPVPLAWKRKTSGLKPSNSLFHPCPGDIGDTESL